MNIYGEYFFGNKISDYGLENGFVDYGTLSKAFDAVLNNDIMQNTSDIGYWDLESGMIDNSDDIEDLEEKIEALEEKIEALEEEQSEAEDDDTWDQLQDTLNNLYTEKEDLETEKKILNIQMVQFPSASNSILFPIAAQIF